MTRRFIDWFNADRMDAIVLGVLYFLLALAILLILFGIGFGIYTAFNSGGGSYE